MEFFIFPIKFLKISQTYSEGNHYPHTQAIYKDYPIDCARADQAPLAAYATVDLLVTAIKGKGSTATNTIWLRTVNKVKTPTFEDYAFLTLTHWNDDDLGISRLHEGSIIKNGELICYDGVDGIVSGPHHHLVCGRGNCNNWIEPVKDLWVMDGDTKKPEDVMYLDRSYTRVISTKSIIWIDLPSRVGTPLSRNTRVKQVKVNSDLEVGYSSAGGTAKGPINKGIYSLLDKSGDYLKIESNLWVQLSSRVTILEIEYAPTEIEHIGDCYIGDTITINLKKALNDVTHTLRYVFGTQSGIIAENVDESTNFKIPKDLYYDMTQSKSAVLTIYCDTYQNGKIYGTTSISFKIMAVASDVVPSVSIDTFIDETTKNITKDDSVVIRGATDLTYTINVDLKYGASVIAYQIEDMEGIKEVEPNGVLENIKIENSLKYRIIDSRGYNEWHTVNFNVIEYEIPTINCYIGRSNNNNLEEITVRYSGSFYNQKLGLKEDSLINMINVKLYYQEDGALNWEEYTSLNPTVEDNTYYEELVLPMSFDKQTIYKFRLEVQDLATTISTNKTIQNEQGLKFDLLYPVGRVIIDFTNKDYSSYLGFEWERTLIGKIPVGYINTDENFSILNGQGGSKYLQAHEHSISGTTSSNGSHTHSDKGFEARTGLVPSKTVLRPGGWDGDVDTTVGNAAGSHKHSLTGSTTSVGNGDGENLPPYQVVNFWKRIA